MRTPRDDETRTELGTAPAMFVHSVTDPAVYAMIVTLGENMHSLTVHVVDPGEPGGGRIADAAMFGRERADVSIDLVVARARRAVAEQADYRAEADGTLVRESIPREVARAAGLHSWVPATGTESFRTYRVAQDWADERVEETGARFADVRLIGGEARVSLHYDRPTEITAEHWQALDDGSGEVARAMGQETQS